MSRPKKTMVCPLGGTGVGGKWQTWIWYVLLDGPRRFSDSQRLLPQASRQMLATQSRALERLGVVHRQVSLAKTLKVEYSFTERGRHSDSVLRQIYTWARQLCEQTGLDYDWPVREEPVERAPALGALAPSA